MSELAPASPAEAVSPEVPAPTPPELVTRSEWQDQVVGNRNSKPGSDGLHEPKTLKLQAEQNPEHASLGVKNVLVWSEDDPVADSVFRRLIDEVNLDEISPEDRVGLSTLEEDDLREKLALEQAGLVNSPLVEPILSSRDLKTEHQKLAQAFSDFRREFPGKVELGIESGYIPDEVRLRIEPGFQSVATRVVDEALFPDGKAGYNTKDEEIVVRSPELIWGDKASTVELLDHEMVHQLSGGTFERDVQTGLLKRTRVGYMSEVAPKKPKRSGLNEFAVVQASLGMVDGDFEALDPDARHRQQDHYYGTRKVFATAFARSSNLLTAKLLMNGLFEETGLNGGTDNRRKLFLNGEAAYGKGAWNRLERMADLAEGLKPEKIEKYILPHIHPPKVAEDGTIIEQGKIDIENTSNGMDIFMLSLKAGEVATAHS